MSDATLDLKAFEGHTPGPWVVWHYNNYTGWSVCATGRGCIAERWYKDAGVVGRLYVEGELEANARLIAAAPTLLAELRALRSLVVELADEGAWWIPFLDSHDVNTAKLDELVARARAATKEEER